MPQTRSPRTPSYRKHKPTGQALVTLNGHTICLGKHGTTASRREYDHLIAEWLAKERTLPQDDEELTVTERIARYWKFAQRY